MRPTLVTAFGESRSLDEWAGRFGICRASVTARMLRGATLEEALSRPLVARKDRSDRLVSAFGEKRLVSEWAKVVGIPRGTIAWRLHSGEDPEEAITRPLMGREEARRRADAANAHRAAQRKLTAVLVESELPAPKLPEPMPSPEPTPSVQAAKPKRERVVKALTGLQLHDVVEVAGARRTIAEWCELNNLTIQHVRNRIKNSYPLARAVSTPLPGPVRLTAHGLTLTLDEWAERTGIPAGTLKSRYRTMRSGQHDWTDERIVSQPHTPTNKPQRPKYEVEPGAPGSISWEVEPWATDPVVRALVRKHPDGMLVEAVCAATGLHDSQCRQTEATALHKLRVAALSGDRAALEFLGAMAGDARDAEELIDVLAENFPKADGEALAALDEMETLDVCSALLDERDAEPDNDNDGMDEVRAELGYASAWAA